MSTAHSPQVAESGTWAGWVRFAAVILLVNGLFSVIQGLAAILGPNAYYTGAQGGLLLFDVPGWGWFTVVLGVVLIATAFGLFGEAAWARTTALVLVIVSSLVQMMLVPVQPWWAIIIIAIDMTIIYALVVRGDEIRQGR
ncbi:hypothetical protein IWX78_000806 [Mycetocola sp. CAN_C7]|uniref:DUF7144 family membrane protein n=1 Tax=Mycetocola sp. CAN_C7 TaxID=2787724 RepID=UPI001A2DDE89